MLGESTAALPEGGLTSLDHVVIAMYLAAMLLMGLSIARRQKSTDDFFVGGRNLPPWAVGISLLASLLSTITYLGMPGEMFRSGIAFLTRQTGVPLVLLIVWFLWIPFFMRLNLTSAYEYLEQRFNYATRALAACFCLLLLFGWMSVVVLTASKAMAEIAHLDLKSFFGVNVAATKTQPDGSALIGPEEIVDWRSVAAVVHRPQDAGDSNFGTHIWGLLNPQQQTTWPNATVNPQSDKFIRELIAEGLSGVLLRRDLYDADAWRSVPIVSDARSYLSVLEQQSNANSTVQLTDKELSHLNRLLIESAFPEAINRSHAEFRDADMHAIILSIGLFSVLYTTLGGIRAVVWTDVIQFFILIVGAFVTMATIAWTTNSGVGDWLAASQAYKHEQVEWFSWDIGNRSTVFSISIGMVFWYICTHGANQVALQRYFSVKNVWAARRSYLVSALSNFVLGLILAGVGISLMYFLQGAEMPAKADIDSAVASVRNEAQDKVFPQFIRFYLPSGVRGLVVAALFAAAMSTIDSGANSVSTIVTVDFVRPLARGPLTAQTELRLARFLTASMGMIIVACTIWLYHISKGTDLITLCQKGFNCFLGPLGALFVLGMFSKRVSQRSVIPAVLVGEIVGVGASYSSEFFGIPFSTHLVVPGSWLATLVAAHVFALLTFDSANAEQRAWMWRPIVRGKAASLAGDSSAAVVSEGEGS